jgi:hypothetical protein
MCLEHERQKVEIGFVIASGAKQSSIASVVAGLLHRFRSSQ